MGNSYSDAAIKAAVEGQWEEAVAINERIIEVSPGDIEAHNRLGKALSELGRNSEARKAYERVLELDPNNSIAQRNLQRLAYLKDDHGAKKESRRIDSAFFIQETSKAGMVTLLKPAGRDILAKMTAGDEVYLSPNAPKLIVTNASGDYLGEVEPKIATRLIELMDQGNEYRAVISSAKDDQIKIIIRETFQHPKLVGIPSFPPTKSPEETRAYIKGSLVKHDTEEDLIEEIGDPGTSWDSEAEMLEQDGLIAEEDILPMEQEDTSRVF